MTAGCGVLLSALEPPQPAVLRSVPLPAHIPANCIAPQKFRFFFWAEGKIFGWFSCIIIKKRNLTKQSGGLSVQFYKPEVQFLVVLCPIICRGLETHLNLLHIQGTIGQQSWDTSSDPRHIPFCRVALTQFYLTEIPLWIFPEQQPFGVNLHLRLKFGLFPSSTRVPQQRRGAGRRLSFFILLSNHISMVLGHAEQFQELPTSLGSSGVWCSLTLLCFSKIYLNSAHGVCQTARSLDSKSKVWWIPCVEMFWLCINLSGLKIILTRNSQREISQACTLEWTC